MLQQYNHERTPWSLVEKSVQSMLYINRVAKTISENSTCVILLPLAEVMISTTCFLLTTFTKVPAFNYNNVLDVFIVVRHVKNSKH